VFFIGFSDKFADSVFNLVLTRFEKDNQEQPETDNEEIPGTDSNG